MDRNEGRWRKLEGNNWEMPEKVAKFLTWLTTPPEVRKELGEPAGIKAWAEANDVTYETTRRWRLDPMFRAEWERILSEMNIRPDRVQQVIDAMYKNAVSGDTKSAELYLRLVDKISPPKVQVIESKSVAQMSNEELSAALEERQRGLRAV